MSAPTPAPGDESPREGYYPDPSIPGYVRYWNGASWVPGTSRPAPDPGPGRQEAPLEETGPVFFDEEDEAEEAARSQRRPAAHGPEPLPAGDATARPEPASAWQADTARQTGFGNDRDRRVSWGGGPQVPGQSAPAGADHHAPVPARPVDPRGTAAPGPYDAPAGPAALPAGQERRAELPAAQDRPALGPGPATDGQPAPENTVTLRADRPAGDAPPTDGTVTMRAVRPGGRTPPPRDTGLPPAEGTMTMRPVGRGGVPGQDPRGQDPQPPVVGRRTGSPQPAAPYRGPAHGAYAPSGPQLAPAPVPQRTAPAPQPPAPAPQALAPQPAPGPRRPQGPGGSAASWAQGGAESAEPVAPWKPPPADDLFQRMVRERSAGRPAGLGKRLAARIVDSVVLGALAGAAGYPLITAALDHIDAKVEAARLSGRTVTVYLVDSTTVWLFAGVLAAFLVIGLLVEALPTARWGRTLGKKLFGLQVRDIESQDAPSFGDALRRWLVYGVLSLLAVGVVNVLWCLFDRPWRQCWHDKAARTYVAG
ncbi:RDD family protein [uncultured Streptomyces sp.]|uniref:RDD family protein n=1 Tax=uncultured Streptomyces sp. TaxID=174707 RepID=UPI00262A9E59|nr:RDD family protein [uncultured Streptomyces sp.]